MISVLDLAVFSLQKIKLAAFEEHFEAKVCCFICCVCELIWYVLRLRAVQHSVSLVEA